MEFLASQIFICVIANVNKVEGFFLNGTNAQGIVLCVFLISSGISIFLFMFPDLAL
jgi:hypothetical protein